MFYQYKVSFKPKPTEKKMKYLFHYYIHWHFYKCSRDNAAVISRFFFLFCQKVIAGLQKRTEHTRTMLHIMHNVENCQAFIKYVYHFLMWFICLVFRLLHGKVYFVHILFILLIYYKPYLNDPCTFFMLSYSQWPLCM